MKTHQETIEEAYDTCGVIYALRSGKNTGTCYIFLVGDKHDEQEVRTDDLQHLLKTRGFMKFKNGELILTKT